MSGIRVIAGIAKGRRLKTKKTKNLRPATDYVKEALFDILVTKVVDSFFLDLFAGSGGIGIEALSRGARKVIFVEKDPLHVALVRENLNLTGFLSQSDIYTGDVLGTLPLLKNKGYQFDLVFVDPPFRKGFLAPVLEKLLELKLVLPGGLIITRSAFGEEINTSETPVREGRYGDSILRFFPIANRH